MVAVAVARGVAGDGCADCVDPCMPRNPFLAAHQGLVCPLAARVGRIGSPAADPGAGWLCRGGQSIAARLREPEFCEIIARGVPPDRPEEGRNWSGRAYRLGHLPRPGVAALCRTRRARLALSASPVTVVESFERPNRTHI